MKKIIALAALVFASSAMAESAGTSETGIRYNEIWAGYSYASISYKGKTFNPTGYGVAGSVLLEKNFIIDASYFSLSGDGVKGTNTALNLGYRTAISSNADAIVKVGYIGAGGDTSESSYQIGAGAVVMLTPEVQLAGQANYTGLKDSSYNYGASLAYYLTNFATIRGSIRYTDGTAGMTTYTIAAGYNF